MMTRKYRQNLARQADAFFRAQGIDPDLASGAAMADCQIGTKPQGRPRARFMGAWGRMTAEGAKAIHGSIVRLYAAPRH